jgi:hypothetical protein
MKTSADTTSGIELNGAESALLVAALFMLDCWAFESGDVRAMMEGLDRVAVEKFADEITLRWQRSLEQHELWSSPTGKWTPELIEQRRRLAIGMSLRLDELPLSVFALRCSASEFSASWWEFCVAAPGAIDQYGASFQDLVSLAERLEELSPAL